MYRMIIRSRIRFSDLYITFMWCFRYILQFWPGSLELQVRNLICRCSICLLAKQILYTNMPNNISLVIMPSKHLSSVINTTWIHSGYILDTFGIHSGYLNIICRSIQTRCNLNNCNWVVDTVAYLMISVKFGVFNIPDGSIIASVCINIY